MIQSLIIFTKEGIPIYSWNWNKGKTETETHEAFVSSFITAVDSLVKNVFLSRLQRIELEDSNFVVTGEEFSYKDEENKPKKILFIISARVDKVDNKQLVNSIKKDILNEAASVYIKKHLGHASKLIKEIEINDFIESYLDKITYARTTARFVLSGLLIFISAIIGGIAFIFDWSLITSESFELTFDVIIGVTVSFSLTIISAVLGGKKQYTVVISFISFLTGSFVFASLIVPILPSIYFDATVGNIAVFYALSIFIAIVGGFLGGLITERLKLFPLNDLILD